MKKRKTIPIAILLVVTIALGSFAFVLFRPKTLEQLTGIQKEEITQIIVQNADLYAQWILEQPAEITAGYEAANGSYRLSGLATEKFFKRITKNVERVGGGGLSVAFVTPEKTAWITIINEGIEYGYRTYETTDCNLAFFREMDYGTALPIS